MVERLRNEAVKVEIEQMEYMGKEYLLSIGRESFKGEPLILEQLIEYGYLYDKESSQIAREAYERRRRYKIRIDLSGKSH